MRRIGCWGTWAAIAATAPLPAMGASAVQGRLTSDGVTGRPAIVGQGWREETIHLTAWTTTSTGGGSNTLAPPQPPGWYSISGSFLGGDYGLFTLSFDGIPPFSVSRITLPTGNQVVDPVELRTPAHYSVMYNEHYNEWAAEPWRWGSNFYQTFVATSPHITRLATKLAGKEGDHWSMTLNFALYRVTGPTPSGWPQVAPTRSYFVGGNVDPIIHIFWVPYRSDEVTLIVGQTYALRVWSAPGSQAMQFAIVARPTSIGNDYTGGHLYIANTPEPGWDAYAHISGGSPGTVVNHAPIANLELKTLVGSDIRFGQRFRASGTSLAAIEVPYATGDGNPPSLPFTFQVYDAVGGNPIGPHKTTRGVSGHYQARAAVCWPENEVPLVPGQFYYVEWTVGQQSVNTWRMEENLLGEGYKNRVSLGSVDLMAIIAEYKQPGPMIALDPDRIERTVRHKSNLPPEMFTVRNAAVGSIHYTITDDADWLSVSPDSGESSGEPDPITVTYDVADLSVGVHTAAITVIDPGAFNSPQVLPVTVTVKAIPGDFDLDGDVDQVDFGEFQVCITGTGFPQTDPKCLPARLDADDDVDADDLGVFLACHRGPDLPPLPGCGE